MRSNKGITMISVLIYVIVLTVVVAIIATITSFFYKNVIHISDESKLPNQYSKLNAYMLEETHIIGNKLTEYDDENKSVTFLSGNTYRIEENGVYRNNLKIFEANINMNSSDWELKAENGKDIVAISIETEEKTPFSESTEYTLESNEEYKSYEEEETYLPETIENTKVLRGSITYNTTNWTGQNVTSTLTTNRKIETPLGWTMLGTDRTQFIKVYSENTSEILTITDLEGKESTVNINIVNIDKTAPTITISSPAMTCSSTNITITVSDGQSGIANGNTYEYQLGTSQIIAPTGTWATYISGTPFTAGAGMNGTYYLWVKKVIDNVGNESAQSIAGYTIEGPYIFDNIAPVITVNPTSATLCISKNVTITITETGSGLTSGNSYEWQLGTSNTIVPIGSWTTYTSGTPFTITGNGTYYLWIKKVADSAGNESTETTGGCLVLGTYVLDSVGPTITINPLSATVCKSTTVTITAADSFSGLASGNSYEWQLGTSNTIAPTGAWTTYTSGTGFTAGTGLTGTYYLWVKQIADNAGNISVATVSTYTVVGSYIFDNTAPVVTIGNPTTTYIKNGGTSTIPITLSESATIDSSKITVSGATGATISVTGSGTSYTATITGGSGSGEITLTVEVGAFTDVAGNQNKMLNNVPAGFSLSSVQGETTTEDGLVIIAPDGSEFVWVPVPNPVLDVQGMNDTQINTAIQAEITAGRYPMAIRVNATDYKGVLYNFSGITSVTVAAETYSATSIKEPNVITSFDNTAANYTNAGITGITNATQFQAQLQSEYNQMIKSVIEKGGFYIGRYETSLNGENAQSKSNVSPMGAITWYSMYQKQKSYITNNNIPGTKSGMIWASEWDQVMIWMKDVPNPGKTKPFYLLDSTGMGWYSDNSSAIKNTGTLTGAKVKNIYDMAGNLTEWTMEAINTDKRNTRGAHLGYPGHNYPVTTRIWAGPNDIASAYGSRLTLHLFNSGLTVDTETPTITVNPTSATVSKSSVITITAADSFSGLASGNTYEWQLGTSNTIAPTGTWTTYTSGTPFTIGTGMNGTYYLWVKQIADNVGNNSVATVSTYTVTGTYVFDNTAPVVTIGIPSTAYIKNGTTATFAITLTETATLNNANITVSGATGASVNTTGSGTSYTATVTGGSGSGAITLTVGAGAFTDAAGNTNVQSTKTGVTVDTALPTISVSPTSGTVVKTRTITITVADTGGSGLASGNSYEWQLGTSNTTAPTGTWTTYTSGTGFTAGTGLTGTYYLWVRQIADNAGNNSVATVSTYTVTGTYIFDNTAPTITVNPTSGTVVKTRTITITVGDIGGSGLASGNSYQWQLGTSNTIAPTGTWTTYTSGTGFTAGTGLTGTYYLWVKQIADNAGNNSVATVSTYTVTGTYVFDNTVPVVTIGNSSATYIRNGTTATFAITLSETATLSSSNITVSGATGASVSTTGSGTSYTATVTGGSGSGAITLTVGVGAFTDAAGNTNVQSTKTGLTVDATIPIITISPSSATRCKSTNILITVSDSGGSGLASGNSYQWQLGTSNTTAPTGTWTNYTSGATFAAGTGLTGTYYLWVRQIADNAGNNSVATISNYTVTGTYVFDNTAPTGSASYNPSTRTTGSVVVTITTSEELQTPSGWTKATTTTYTKTYTAYTTEVVTITDLAGNTGSVNVNVTNIVVADGSWNGTVNTPKLAANMTPVKWDISTNVESTTTIIDIDWYNYVAQSGATTTGGTSKWANAKTTNGSYLVWIPRYEYRITSGEHTATAGVIDVKFIPTTQTTADSGYTIHPAFTNTGNRGLGELSGFWVGKFESSSENGSQGTSGNNVKIVPTVASWRTLTLSQMFTKAQAFSTNNSLTGYDSHVMKNSEWGAVAYLAHSQYGRNGTEITINNNSNYITGIAGNTVSAAASTATTNTYNTNAGKLASTTGNPHGVYDMSGAAYEYVMGVYNNTIGSSGFSSLPATKYFDNYPTAYSSCSTIKGDAVYETSSNTGGTNGWFTDGAYYVTSSYVWFSRGSYYTSGTGAGLFSFGNYPGSANAAYGFRVVCTK